MVYNTLSTKDPLCAVFAFEIGSVEASHPGPQRHQLPHPSWHLCGARWAVGGAARARCPRRRCVLLKGKTTDGTSINHKWKVVI